MLRLIYKYKRFTKIYFTPMKEKNCLWRGAENQKNIIHTWQSLYQSYWELPSNSCPAEKFKLGRKARPLCRHFVQSVVGTTQRKKTKKITTWTPRLKQSPEGLTTGDCQLITHQTTGQYFTECCISMSATSVCLNLPQQPGLAPCLQLLRHGRLVDC